MKPLLFFLLTFVCTPSVYTQVFSGSIDFKYATSMDTTATKNVYWVKNKLVRLDQYSKKGANVEGSFIFDLEAHEIRFLSPKRKLWGKQKSETPQVIKGQCIVTKGSSTKKIAGLKCVDYTVKNSEENTVIVYWIADEKFEFFMPLIKLWNRKDKQSVYFAQIKNLGAGQMPMMSEEKQISDGKMLTRLEVIKISKSSPSDSIFEVPAGYTKFEAHE